MSEPGIFVMINTLVLRTAMCNHFAHAAYNFAIIFSGYVVPALNQGFGPSGWRISWIVLATIVFCVAVVAALLIRNDPAEKSLSPVGQTQEMAYDPSASKGSFRPAQILTHLGGLYAIFGATYVVYGTFIVTTMVEE